MRGSLCDGAHNAEKNAVACGPCQPLRSLQINMNDQGVAHNSPSTQAWRNCYPFDEHVLYARVHTGQNISSTLQFTYETLVGATRRNRSADPAGARVVGVLD